jgi:glycosyltransferase involved in cell wall biosynthesis
MHLTALVESPDHVCCRYRIAAYRPFLAEAGHTLEIQALPRNWWARLRLIHGLAGASVVLQRKLLPGWQLALLRRRVARLLFDFDDAVYLRDSYSSRGLRHAGRLRRFAATVRACDAVLAGNDFLRVNAMFRTERARVHVVPTCVDPGRYPLHKAPRGAGPVRLVWVGSSSTLQGLERSAPLLNEVGARVPGLRLKLVCDRTVHLRSLPVDLCPWSEATEAEEIAAADVGISWVPDDDWSRGKCGLKVLQYMAAGLPVVANPVGVHVEMVHHEETGFLAETTGEWVAALARLAGDPGLRERMGRAGRRVVEERYSVPVGAKAWLTVLDGLRRPATRSA